MRSNVSVPVSAIRLQNGNTLVGSLRKLSEFDPEGTLVWSFDPVKDGHLPEGQKGHVTGLAALGNRTVAFAFYHREADGRILWWLTEIK